MGFNRIVSLLPLIFLAPVASAAPLNLRIETTHTHFDSAGQPATELWQTAALMEPTFSATLVSYKLFDGSGQPFGNNAAGSGFASTTPLRRSTFAGFIESVSAAPWTLDVTTNLGASRYQLAVDMSTLAEPQLISAQMNTPQPFEQVGARPTFSWTPSSSYQQGFFTTDNAGADWVLLSPTTDQSYTPTTPLSAGPHRLELDLLAPVRSLPVTPTLISGVDQGPMTASLRFEYRITMPYSVPEPGPLTGVVAAALSMVSCRWRSRGRHDRCVG